MATHVTRVRVRWGDTDAAGIVFYPTFFAWFDQAGMELLEACGITPERIKQERVGAVLVSASATFRASAGYGDRLEVRTTVERLSARSVELAYSVSRVGESEPLATGKEARVFVSLEGKRARAIPWPPEVAEALRQYTG